MSNYMHLECWSHEPHIVDDSWVGQHNEDLPAIRLALSDRIVSGPASCASGAVERARNLAAFIHRHPNCDIRVVDEAGDDRTAPEPDLHMGSHSIPRWSIDGIPIRISESAPNRCGTIMQPIKVRKKPVTIEAMQNTRAQYMDVYQWIERNTLGSFDMTEYEGDGAPKPPASGVSIDPTDGRMVISTLEGMHWVNLGDWVIRGVAGEFYPCKSDIFEATYEEATA